MVNYLCKPGNNIQWEKSVSSTNGVGQAGKLHVKEWNCTTFFSSYSKLNSKWIKDLNVRPKTINILADSTGINSSDINHSKIFLDKSPEAREIKAKRNWKFITIKSLCPVKETINKTKGHVLNGRRYLKMKYPIKG